MSICDMLPVERMIPDPRIYLNQTLRTNISTEIKLKKMSKHRYAAYKENLRAGISDLELREIIVELEAERIRLENAASAGITVASLLTAFVSVVIAMSSIPKAESSILIIWLVFLLSVPAGMLSYTILNNGCARVVGKEYLLCQRAVEALLAEQQGAEVAGSPSGLASQIPPVATSQNEEKSMPTPPESGVQTR